MEPPIDYGLTYRSIGAERPSLESCFRTFPATTREPVRVSADVSRNPWVRPEMVIEVSNVE